MPKIPTFQAKGRITTDAPGVTTGIQISPTATTASALLPGLNTLTDYAIKKRDVAEKVQANKKVFEMKGEFDKFLKAEEENIDDENAINNFKNKYNDYIKQELSLITNNRIKNRIKQNLDLEYSEYVYNIKKNSYTALEKNALENVNNNINSYTSKYSTTTDVKLKSKYINEAKNTIKQFAEDFDLPQNVLDQKLKAVDRDFLLADIQQFSGATNGQEAIKLADSFYFGEKTLNNDDFGKGVFDGYKQKISELTIKGDPNSDYDRAIELIDELKEFKRGNGYKIKTGDISVQIDNLEQQVLTEQITHDKQIKNQLIDKDFKKYSDNLRGDLTKSITGGPFAIFKSVDIEVAATEAGKDFDNRIQNYIATYPESTLAEKQAFARNQVFLLQSKYEDANILKSSAFNLETADTDVIGKYNETVTDMKKLSEGTLDENIIQSYENLAKANGYQDIESFMNDYLPLLKSKIQGK